MWCSGGSVYPEVSRRVQVHLEWGHLPAEGARPVATGVNLRNPKDRTGRFIVSDAGFASVGDVPRGPRGARSRALASRGSSLLRGFRGGASRRGRPLRPPFNAQLRTGTD
ncbi:hypothetical protein ALC62_15474 [Cyphomyrmex costatus]|uniref:Uncharacterized protein n=1 Tax=Cyphomyrmex costatus TaxID=456900 RepID=A0A151I746_9HYME|nr:hypothetical protein ALC62_15474 [Cyphomyrmex costatus]